MKKTDRGKKKKSLGVKQAAVTRNLPEDQRQVLELSYFKGLNHVEISDHLDLSLGTVKSRIRLGIEKLRNSLSNLRI